MPDEQTQAAPPAAPPAEPTAPATPVPGQVVEPTIPPAKPSQENEEWDQALTDLQKENGLDPGKPKEEPKKDEQAKPEEKPQATPEAETDSKDQKPDEESKPGDDTEKKGGDSEEAGKPGEAGEVETAAPEDRSVRDVRAVQREIAEESKVVQKDVKEKLYPDLQTEILDAEGEPIRTIEDVMQHVNPNTKKAFTEEEAGAYLLRAQQHLNKQLEEADKRVETVTETLLSIKDQSDYIRSKYGALLQANPNGIRDKIWQEYNKTLVRDKESGIIIDAPVSLQNFYETALAPYVELAKQMEADDKAKKEAETKVDEAKKEAERVKSQSDRQDIYSGGRTETQSKEDKEWEQANREHYEGK